MHEEETARRRSSVNIGDNETAAQNAVASREEGNCDRVHQTHRSLPVRAFWFMIGVISLGLGGLGVVLPGLPTVPFIILASFAFFWSSETLYNWLVNSKAFGPIIRQWNDHRALPSNRVKGVAVALVIVCCSASITYFAFFSNFWWAAVVIALICGTVCIFLLRLPVVKERN